MCEPTTIMMGLGIASAVAGGVGQARVASNARSMARSQHAMQTEEINAQSAVQASERSKAARAERARFSVAAGEAGVSGVSVNDAMFDMFLQEDLDLGLLAKDKQFALRASDGRRDSIIASNRGPSGLELGLGIASAGYAGYSSGLQIKQQRNSLTPPPEVNT